MDAMPDMEYHVIRRAFQTLKDADQGLTVTRKDMSWQEYQVFQILQPYYQKAKHSTPNGDNLKGKL